MVLQSIVTNKTKEEERAHGVFYDDEYDYLQHLKDPNKVEHDWSEADRFIMQAKERKEKKDMLEDQEMRRLKLPSEVFGTIGQEEDVGLLNKAAPHGLDLSLDPDVVAALDDDYNFDDPDNEFDDDFIMQLNEEGGDGDFNEDADDEEWEDDSDDCAGGRSDDEADDEVPSLMSWTGEETGTKFTNYSMSSSVIRRNNQLSLLDDKFDKFMDQYDEAEEGALDGEEIEGHMEESNERMSELLAEADREKATRRQQLDREREVIRNVLLEDSDKEEDLEIIRVEEKNYDKWDCESFLSTYSTLYNHPKIISEPRSNKIQLSSKTGIPKNVLGRGLTAAALEQLDRENNEVDDDIVSIKSKISELSIRPKHETAEEKRERKSTLKQARRERREEKKANTTAFKSEKMKQEKNMINNKNNLQGIKIY